MRPENASFFQAHVEGRAKVVAIFGVPDGESVRVARLKTKQACDDVTFLERLEKKK
jgi:hypothetical protein